MPSVPNNITKCVGFAAYESGNGRVLCGTVFVTGRPLDGDHSVRFAVTARHVVEAAAQRSADAHLFVRLNARTGGFLWLQTRIMDWQMHPTDAAVDCAAIIMPVPPEADVLAFNLKDPMPPDTPDSERLYTENWITDGAITRLQIGPGDDVFFPGLFVRHVGTTGNIPIIRFGTVAAMQSEPVATERGPMDAYLIEARSIGGLSGSPAFLTLPQVRPWTNEGGRVERQLPYVFFLGLVHGHWNVLPTADNVNGDGLSDEAVNMGIAIILPAERVIEVLDQPAFADEIARIRQELP